MTQDDSQLSGNFIRNLIDADQQSSVTLNRFV